MAAIPVGASMGVLLYGVSPFDPVTLVASICVLLFGATTSMIGPARRAGRIAPIDALREGS
jgi:ABC-type antimicrobial peptide transport system permease subunit